MSNTEKKQILRLALEIASISFKLRDEVNRIPIRYCHQTTQSMNFSWRAEYVY